MKHAALGRIIAAAMLVLPPFVPAANAITYLVNRTLGADSVTGYIVTDGTLGDMDPGYFTSWQLTISAPNLNGGPTQTKRPRPLTSTSSGFRGPSRLSRRGYSLGFSSILKGPIWGKQFAFF